VTWIDRFLSLQFTWRDAVDVVVVAAIIYSILSLIRGSRAMQMSIGLTVLGSTFFIARAFDLPALEVVSRQIIFYLPFAVIVLFQQEIRRGLARVGGNPLMIFFQRRISTVPIEALVEAAATLAAKHIGALIAIEGSQTLRMYTEPAKPLDALVTSDLLITIFTPGGPLHDGAAIVRQDRIVAAGAFLPLTPAPDPQLAHGTRHRAALGLSEESDALLIVVSEENGEIAMASEGVLQEHLTPDMLRQLLTTRFGGAR
jgi:diadenylate cyclase